MSYSLTPQLGTYQVMHKSLDHTTLHIDFSFSIVSHGQGSMIRNLLSDFVGTTFKQYEILITLNLPEDEGFMDAFSALPIKIIRNSVGKGFGHNHNEAFKQSRGRTFVVLNPDVRFKNQTFDHLWHCLRQPNVGACAPLVRSPSGVPEDSARPFPSFLTIVKRYIGGIQAASPSYEVTKGPVVVDWTAGMFIAFHRETYQLVKGFDQNYFMYYEDVDICMRLKYAGYRVMLVPQVSVVHDAQRASRKKLNYLRWHFMSALRFTAKHFAMKIRYRQQKIS